MKVRKDITSVEDGVMDGSRAGESLLHREGGQGPC